MLVAHWSENLVTTPRPGEGLEDSWNYKAMLCQRIGDGLITSHLYCLVFCGRNGIDVCLIGKARRRSKFWLSSRRRFRLRLVTRTRIRALFDDEKISLNTR